MVFNSIHRCDEGGEVERHCIVKGVLIDMWGKLDFTAGQIQISFLPSFRSYNSIFRSLSGYKPRPANDSKGLGQLIRFKVTCRGTGRPNAV